MDTLKLSYIILAICIVILFYYTNQWYKKQNNEVELFTNKNKNIKNVKNTDLNDPIENIEYVDKLDANNSINYKQGVPKIIHQTAPKNRNLWSKTWYECHKTWQKHFPTSEYKHILWYDEDLDHFIKTKHNWFYKYYKNYPKNINRIDIARYFILYTYGGIYADMDYYCSKNFYKFLDKNKVTIVESPYKENEHLHNCLMASPKGHPFWFDVINEILVSRHYKSVLDVSGPRVLDRSYNKNNNVKRVKILPQNLFNPRLNSNDFYSKSN